MPTNLFVFVLCLVWSQSFAQQVQLTLPEDVPQKMGDTVTVRCRIVDVVYQPNDEGKPTFLDQNHSWRKNPFVIVIFEEDVKNGFPLSLEEAYLNKTVEMTGVVEKHLIHDNAKGVVYERIGLRLRSGGQIRVVE
jgi:hypothetical protein